MMHDHSLRTRAFSECCPRQEKFAGENSNVSLFLLTFRLVFWQKEVKHYQARNHLVLCVAGVHERKRYILIYS